MSELNDLTSIEIDINVLDLSTLAALEGSALGSIMQEVQNVRAKKAYDGKDSFASFTGPPFSMHMSHSMHTMHSAHSAHSQHFSHSMHTAHSMFL